MPEMAIKRRSLAGVVWYLAVLLQLSTVVVLGRREDVLHAFWTSLSTWSSIVLGYIEMGF